MGDVSALSPATLLLWPRSLGQLVGAGQSDRVAVASVQARYFRAVEGLACVRRLLKRPTVQVNIAGVGGQQVNIAGDTQT